MIYQFCLSFFLSQLQVADFGLSKEIDNSSDYFISDGGKIPIRWTSPEAIQQRYVAGVSETRKRNVIVIFLF